MANRNNDPTTLTVPIDRPLIGVIEIEDGREVVRYTTEDPADSPGLSPTTLRALSVIGAWSDLDWDEAERELDRIRHGDRRMPPSEDDAEIDAGG